MTAADKLRELLRTRPAFPGLTELVRWWRAGDELVQDVLAELDVLRQEVRELEQQRDELSARLAADIDSRCAAREAEELRQRAQHERMEVEDA